MFPVGPVVQQRRHGGGGGGGGFDPSTISGLQMWLDIGDTSTLYQDSGKTTAVTSVDDPIGCWADKSGNANDFTSSTGQRPLYKTTSALFDGSDDQLTSPTWTSVSQFMLGVNIKPNDPLTSLSNGYLAHQSSVSSGTPFLLITEGVGVLRIYIDGGYRFTPSVSSGSQTRIVLRVTKPSTDYLVDAWINGVKQSQYNGGPALPGLGATYSFYLGNGYPSWGNMNTDRFVLYAGSYSDTDAENVDEYLANGEP